MPRLDNTQVILQISEVFRRCSETIPLIRPALVSAFNQNNIGPWILPNNITHEQLFILPIRPVIIENVYMTGSSPTTRYVFTVFKPDSGVGFWQVGINVVRSINSILSSLGEESYRSYNSLISLPAFRYSIEFPPRSQPEIRAFPQQNLTLCQSPCVLNENDLYQIRAGLIDSENIIFVIKRFIEQRSAGYNQSSNNQSSSNTSSNTSSNIRNNNDNEDKEEEAENGPLTANPVLRSVLEQNYLSRTITDNFIIDSSNSNTVTTLQINSSFVS
jgi:hypothetical protein